MALEQEDFEQIEQLIEQRIADTSVVRNENVYYELELKIRMQRLEDESKHSRELIVQRFEWMDERFKAASEENNRRFEQVEKKMDEQREENNRRFAEAKKESNRRFEQVDKRFEAMHQEIVGLRVDIHRTR